MTRCRTGLAAAAVVAVLSAGPALLTGGPAAAAVAAPGTGTAAAAVEAAAATRGTGAAGSAVAALGSSGAAAATLRIGTRQLPPGIRGLYYLTALTAAGGTAPYTWSAARLPAGLKLSAGGLLTGYPLSLGGQDAMVRVRDARGRVSLATLPLRVPSSLPGGCVARSCALLAAYPRTVAVPAGAIVSLTGPAGGGPAGGGLAIAGQATAGQATAGQTSLGQSTAGMEGVLLLRGGPAVAAGDVLALAAAPPVPSGLVAVAESVTAHGADTVVAVRTATTANAYYAGTVQAQGTLAGAAAAVARPPARPVTRPVAAVPATTGPRRTLLRAPAGAALTCPGGVTSQLHGLGVTPSMTPSVAAQWARGRYGLPARRAAGAGQAPGGLRLFQFALSGTITVNLGVSVSGPARCTMTLPAEQRAVPAGGLGAVVLRLRPTLTLVTSGELDVAASVTLTCDAAYRLYAGTVTRTDHCGAADQPLRMSSLGGASATVSGAIAVSAALDGVNVVTGTTGAALHAGYYPGGATVAETDVTSGFSLTAPLGRLWPGAARAAVADGTAFSALLSASAHRPPRATGPSVLAAVPAVAYPWSAAVCGYSVPTFGHADFTVAGGGFLPGERARVNAGWALYPRLATAGPGGSFGATNWVGEVPAVLGQVFGVAARGTAGSAANTTIKLDADGCLTQSGSAGRLTLRWGGNGFDPDARLALSVNGTVVRSAEAGDRGSGGATAGLSCPAAGRYQWQVSGTVNGGPAAASGWLSCVPLRVSPVYPGAFYQGSYLPASARQRTGAPAVSTPVRQPWRVPPARPPLT